MFSKPNSKYKVSSRQPVKANAPSGNPGPTVTSLPVDAAPSLEGETTETKHLQLWPLESREMVKMFLKDIHGGFVDNVMVIESGLHDKLTECGVIMASDGESLCGTHLPTRKDKARHLWKILSTINHEIFVRDVLPPLCERYYHIIPSKYRKSETAYPPVCTVPPARTCVRCDIKCRVRECDMADFLLKNSLLDLPNYNEIIRNHRLQKPDWHSIFAAFEGQGPAARRHQADMTSLLERHSLSVPSDLPDLMSQGFPCRCQQQQQQAVRRDGVTGAERLSHANYSNSLREFRSVSAIFG